MNLMSKLQSRTNYGKERLFKDKDRIVGGVKKQFLSPLAIPLESSISLYRCVADLAGNTSIEGEREGGGLKEGGGRARGNAAMLRFYDVSFIFRDNRSARLNFPSHFLFQKIHFLLLLL